MTSPSDRVDQTVPIGTPLALRTTVTDDGNPKPRREFDRGVEGTTNLRQLLRVSWFQWRGPGRAKFDPESVPVTNAAGMYSRDGGSATTKATFDKPGKYVLICNVAGHYGLGMRVALRVE